MQSSKHRLTASLWVAGLLISLCASCTGPSEPPLDPLRTNASNVGIDGFSPVSYFESSAAERGNREFTVTVDGVDYWLTDAAQVQRFKANPRAYLPAHGGWCTLMMGGSGRRTPGHPESFAIVDDRLMLFWSGDTPATAGMGLQNWHSKTKGKLELERSWIADADEQWKQFVAGARHADIYLYKPSDAESISPAQRATATEAFVE